MKKVLFFTISLISAINLLAQNVGIGTNTPDASAKLDVVDANRGLLIPRVNLTATNAHGPVTNPATSLLVYNTANAGTPPDSVWPGFYYWDGAKWVRLDTGNGDWKLDGNSITSAWNGTSGNFLGTTNAQPLVIATTNTASPQPIQVWVGNQETFRFNPPGTSAPAWSIHRRGGNPRGLHAVDLQSNRWAVTQVASGNYSVIGGGNNNTASSDFATVGGGDGNTASSNFATVGGGSTNTASSNFATVGGGYNNNASGYIATVGGGYNNNASGIFSVIGGGYYITASSNFATVGGGYFNTAGGITATVGGGHNNTASGFRATVGGGYFNTASGSSATVGGGDKNTANGIYATVGGGYNNTANGYSATIGGGYNNTASGIHSVVPGGYGNTANADYNLVFGLNVGPSVTETHRVYFFGDGSGPVFNPNTSGFLVINRLDGDHPIHVGTTTFNGNGAHLTTGGSWVNTSSRSFKERFVHYRPAEVLEKILQLPVEGYFYKGTEEYHITPMAEDFYRLFLTGVHEIIETDSTGQLVRRPNPDVDKYLAASDVAGVAILGVQALHEENAQLRQRVADLERENAQLRQEVSDIRTENAALRARLERLETLVQKTASTQTNH